MKMLNIVVALLVCLFLTSPLFAADKMPYSKSPAQTTAKGEAELTQTVIRAEKQQIVARNMQLSEEQGKVFWPVYYEYQLDLKKNSDNWIKLVREYATNYKNLSDKKADSLMTRFLEVDKTELELKKDYMKKFNKVLPAKKVALYYQLENKMAAVVNMELAREIPLVR